MSMSNYQDREDDGFDDFIRRSVEDPKLRFDPKAWEAMEQKLDTRSGGNGFAGNAGKVIAVALLLMLFSYMGWLLLSNRDGNDSVVLNETPAAKEKIEHESAHISGDGSAGTMDRPPRDTKSLHSPGNNKKNSEEHSPAVGSTKSMPASSEAVSSGPASSGPASFDTIKEEDGSLPGKPGAIKEQEVNKEQVKEQEVNEEQEVNFELEKSKDDAGSKAECTKVAVKVVSTAEASTAEVSAAELWVTEEAKEQKLPRISWQGFSLNTGEILPSGLSSGLPVRAEEPEPEQEKEQKKEQEQPASGGAKGEEKEEEPVPAGRNEFPLSLSLSLAPDFSGTDEAASARLGAGAGFHLEYRVLPRLGLVAGLLYSQKNYLANSRYAPYDFGSYRPEPDYIDARCGVLDIPLNLRYYFLQGKRNSFYLSSGLSSYLMKREAYKMVYANGYYEDYTYELRNENNHYFAVFNLSAGYEARISSRWALQVEPFLKIPASGVGAAAIRLNSMGAFMHFKYSIGR
jgi:hypothetical protein